MEAEVGKVGPVFAVAGFRFLVVIVLACLFAIAAERLFGPDAGQGGTVIECSTTVPCEIVPESTPPVQSTYYEFRWPLT
jgi:hypothetical protein